MAKKKKLYPEEVFQAPWEHIEEIEEPLSLPIPIRPEGEIVKLKKLSKNAEIPAKKTSGAAAFDIYCPQRVQLEPGKTTIVPLGFAVEIPPGFELKIIPRSGLSSIGVTIKNSPGTIDSDYRGEVGVIIHYQPEDLCHRIEKLYKALTVFCRNLTSTNQMNLDEARNRLLDKVTSSDMEPYIFEAGDRICQLQLQKVIEFHFVETDTLSDTDRGEGGFGSSGR